MERRVLLAIALSFAVLFAYQALFIPPPTPTETINATPPSATPSTGAALPTAAPTPTPDKVEATSVPAVAMIEGEGTERDIVVDTQKVRATFTNRGARLRHWVLKDYRNERGDPLDLIPETIPTGLPLPFSLRLDDPGTTRRLNDALFRASVTNSTLDASSQPATLAFDAESADGVTVRKTFTFEPASYVVGFSGALTVGGQTINPTIEWGPGLGDEIARTPPGSFFSPAYVYLAQAIYHTQGDVERVAATSIGGGSVREGQFRWAGVDDHYFLSAVLDPPSPLRVEYLPISGPSAGNPPVVGHYVSYAVRFPAPPDHVRFYIGPKQLDVMQAVDPELTRAIYFGIFAWLAAPLLTGLKWVHGFIGDWGWSIIILTILINLAMFPLRHKSAVSMRRMQELQPQMKAIQERYARYKITDPERQKMNTEVMELYKARGVNPASGCVPMLLMMPFLFAFYAMLGQAIEIRGEGFLGWIPDLSRSDPFYITPMLMGATMFWQMRLQPTTADPTQQKIMMFMPVMITATMLFAPSGLVIYWLVSNVWTIGQQYFTNWMIGPPKPPAVRPKDARPAKDIIVTKEPERQKK
jgi:YidC/Oxa1 family membrane protein insertase